MTNPRRPLLLAALVAIAAPAFAHGEKKHTAGPTKKEQKAWGIAGERGAARRTVRFEMSDAMRFTPDRIEVKLGETLHFVVRNHGKLLHEFVIGTKAENAAHAELMKKFPNMEHDEPYMAHVAAGKTGEIVWTFNRAGTFEFACLVAGHFDAGMVGTIVVRPA